MKWPDAREVTRHVLWLPCSVPARFRLRGLAKIRLPIMAQGFWPLARRERRAYPAHGSVRSEQRSQRPKDQARMGKFILARPLRRRLIQTAADPPPLLSDHEMRAQNFISRVKHSVRILKR